MRSAFCLVVIITGIALPIQAAKPTSDREILPGTPRGSVVKMPEWNSKVFPGTKREWWIYVPAQYRADAAAAVMVFQDGHDYVRTNGGWRVAAVFDNLIHKGEMPVTIGVFLNPGHSGKSRPQSPWRVSNRSFEYDTLTDQYVRFLLEEMLPEVSRRFRLTEDPKLRAIGGASSGGICAWTVAWERPDAFRKVLSTIGSFTNIRGGDAYPALIRKTERKPIRIWLQDGRNDVDNPHGNWPIGNQRLAAALAYQDYDYKFACGKGEHNSNEAGPLLPAALRWLWRDWKTAP